MIEAIENALQLTATGICAAICFIQAYRMKEREWDILALFYAAIFLGDLYWLLFLLFNGDTPPLSYVWGISWYAAYMFLLILLRFVEGEETTRVRHKALWLVPIWTVGMCIYYMQFGDYFGNIMTAFLMSMLIWRALRGFMYNRNKFCAVVLLYCAVEYAMWTASCIWEGDTIANPYFWLDFMFTICLVIMLPIFSKAVSS